MKESACALIEEKKEILLVLENNGTWSFPGGKKEINETLEDTAVRETFEETGLKISIARKLGYYSYDNTQKHVFVGKISGGNLKQGKWFPIEDVLNAKIPLKRKYIPLALRDYLSH
ncbi:MAG: NUDIX hydrolase [Candidatus Diapherotrites archaeon]|nr:NUDIX hydrolase [Candidatus Diapherotrites archaeon]